MRRGDFGDLYVQVKTEVPVYLNKKQKELLEQFREIENDKSNPSIKKFFFQKAKILEKLKIMGKRKNHSKTYSINSFNINTNSSFT